MENTSNKKDIIAFLSTGKLGLMVMHSLIKKGYNVKIITRDNSQKNIKELKELGAEIYKYELSKFYEIDKLISENSQIYIGNMYQRNVIKKIIDLLKKNEKKISKLVFVSGANSKEISEAHNELENFENEIMNILPMTIIIKPTMIFGINKDNNIEKIFRWLKNYPVFVIIGDGKTLYQPIHYFDIKNAIVQIFKINNINGKKILIGGRDALEYEEIVKIIKKKINSKTIIIKLPQKLLYTVSLFLNNISNLKVITEKIKNIHVHRNVNNENAIKLLKYHPNSFEDRLDDSIKTYQNKK